MHRSRIGVVHLDHPEEVWEDALGFWAGVQGVLPAVEDPAMPEYLGLGDVGTVPLYAQRLGAGTQARLHLDIETDDVDAEIARLVALGAEVRERRDGWTVLTDPAGLAFCVVPIQRQAEFDREACTWA